MANWLEELEKFGGSVLDAASEGVSSRIKRELDPDAPTDPAGRPETQYDTRIEEPVDGPESMKTGAGNVLRAFDDTWGQYKWWIAGGLAVTAYLAIRRAR